MSHKSKAKTNITKITANSTPRAHAEPNHEPVASPKINTQPETKSDSKSEATHHTHQSAEVKSQSAQASSKQNQPSKPSKTTKSPTEKPLKEVFILARPFVALGRYLRDSWRELRQVRWPNRKTAWKMAFAVFGYCAIFMIFILILDALFTFIFNLLLGVN